MQTTHPRFGSGLGLAFIDASSIYQIAKMHPKGYNQKTYFVYPTLKVMPEASIMTAERYRNDTGATYAALINCDRKESAAHEAQREFGVPIGVRPDLNQINKERARLSEAFFRDTVALFREVGGTAAMTELEVLWDAGTKAKVGSGCAYDPPFYLDREFLQRVLIGATGKETSEIPIAEAVEKVQGGTSEAVKSAQV